MTEPRNETGTEANTTEGRQETGDIVSDEDTTNRKQGKQTGGQPSRTASTTDDRQDTGDIVPAAPPTDPAPAPISRETMNEVRARVWGRFSRECRDLASMSLVRNQMMKDAKKAIPDKEDRQRWVYSELDRLYPPLDADVEIGNPHKITPNRTMSALPHHANDSGPADDGQIQGLGDIPVEWGELPSNASISSEVAWVQANRLRVVEERPGRATLVHLDRAMSAAPSWSALGWLETSIRSYAKFVDVAAKVSGSSDDESAVVRRERMAIEEVRSLLDEMRADRDQRAAASTDPNEA